MMRKSLFLLSFLFLAACSPVKETIPTGYVSCVHIKDSKLNFIYDKKTVQVWTNDTYNVEGVKLIDVKGRVITLNKYEIANFECKEY